jgi:hypothetical protein
MIAFAAISFGAIAQENEKQKLLNYDMVPIKNPVSMSLAEMARNNFPQEVNKASAGEENPRKDFDYSIGFGGWSHHNTGNRPNTFNEVNPTLELDVWTNFRLLGGRPLVGVGRTLENSKNGSTDFAFAANQWTVARGEYANLCVGGGAMYAKYRDGRAKPGNRASVEGVVPLAYGCLEFNDPRIRNFSIRAIYLGSKITLVYLVYSWR